jgi:Rha family phage regulatory protein
MKELVFKGQNDQALTNSLLVAETFGKEHKHVLESIRELVRGCAENSSVPMFVETTYENDNNGQTYPMFIMNRDGFTLLAMGFTGKRALAFKLEYIKAFNEMEKALKEQKKPLSQAELLVQSAQLLLEQEQRLSNVESRIDKIEKEKIENTRLLFASNLSSEKIPEMSMRDNVRSLVNKYSAATDIPQQDVWHKIYDQLYYLYHISVKAYKKDKKETYLDVAERNHFLDKMYAVISNMIREKGI